MDHFVDDGGCDKTCETMIGIALVLVGQVNLGNYLIISANQNLL